MRLLLGCCAILTMMGIVYVIGMVIMVHGLTTLDPFPPFMTDYQPNGYLQAEPRFNEFVGKTFPIGSDAQDAIAKIAREGFAVAELAPDTWQLDWNRHAGPCSEHYLIIILQRDNRMIAEITGRLGLSCL